MSEYSRYIRRVLIQVILPAFVIAGLYVLVVFFILLPRYGNLMINQKKKIIRYQVESLFRVFWSLHQEVQRGRLTLLSAKKYAAGMINKLRYGPGKKSYCWAHSLDHNVVAHPNLHLRALMKKKVRPLRDKRAKYIARKFINAVKATGEGYVRYHVQWQDVSAVGHIVPKIAYLKLFKPWGWVVGTGIFYGDVKRELARTTRDLLKYSLIVGLALCLFVFYLVLHGFSLERKRFQNEKELCQLNQDLEVRVEARTNELERSLQELRNMQAQLIESEKMSALGGLVAGVAHEINTPIGVCVTAASYLGDALDELIGRMNKGAVSDQDLDQFIKHSAEAVLLVRRNLSKAASLVHSFKRVAVDQSVEEVRRFYVCEYLSGILLSLQNLLKKNEVEVIVDCPESLYVESYPGAFSQIITQLAQNALQHAFRGTGERRILIKVYQRKKRFVVEFSDNGVGMSEKQREKIFEPFYTTSRSEGSVGLGLHIVYNIVVRKLAGYMACVFSVTSGTKFMLDFPLRVKG